MRKRVNVIVFTVIVGICTLALAHCTKPYRDQVREREFAAIESYLKAQKLNVWKYDDLYYAAEQPGDSLRTQDGDILELNFAIFALTRGKPLLIATNDTATARSNKLPPQAYDTIPLRAEIGKTKLIKGLELGLKNYAHLHGRAWLGIPSDLAFGTERFVRVPSNTPILCRIEVINATSERVIAE